MLSSKAFLSLLMRLPLFLVVHSASVVFFGEFSWVTVLSAFIPFLLLSLLDEFIENRKITIAISVVVGAAAFALGFIVAGVLVVCLIFFRWEMFDRPEIFSKGYFIFGIAAHVVLVYFAHAGGLHIILISLFLNAVLLPICLQGSRLNGFLFSHHARLVSSKTTSTVKVRSFIFHLLLIAVAAIFSIIITAAISENVVEIPTIEIEQEENDFPHYAQEPREDVYVEYGRVEFIEEIAEIIVSGAGNVDGIPLWLDIVIFSTLLLPVLVLAFWAAGKYFRPKHVKDDYDDIVEVETVTHGQKIKKRKKQRLSSINRTVRKLFVNKVYEYKTQGLTPARYDTPRNLSDIISETEDISTLDKLYHKARYSGNDVSGGELNAYHKERRGKK